MAAKLTKAQIDCLAVLADARLPMRAADVGYRLTPGRGQIGATSALRALERRQLVNRHPPRDQWSTANWSIRDAGRQALTGEPG